jgi:hypothetical protein
MKTSYTSHKMFRPKSHAAAAHAGIHLQDALHALDLQAAAVDREAVLALGQAAVGLPHLVMGQQCHVSQYAFQ